MNTSAQRHRSSGILLHITSLPSRYGIGDLGPGAHDFLQSLAKARQTWWQTLPLGPGDCPYQSFSAMAGNPNLISPDLLFEAGLLDRTDIEAKEFPQGAVDFHKVTVFKQLMLARAWERFQAGAARHLRDEIDQFCVAESNWLDDYALFMTLRAAHPGVGWANWPSEIALRKKAALREARRSMSDAIGRCKFAQFLFFRQLAALRQQARGLGLMLIGDLPIFVSGESADVWSHPHLFLLDKSRRPKLVAGVPPDYFSPTGQRWGNPLYNWKAMQKDGFHWWIERARMALRQADLVRIDHFRGFAACWTIPASEPTAERGRWVPAPGVELFAAMRQALGDLPFIAEDLGLITPDVEKLRDDLALPGMRVLQFGFGGDASNPFLPHNFVRNAVVYTGTHDNDTTLGWYRSLSRVESARVRRYIPQAARDPAWALMRLAWSSVADIAIAPLQDVLRLGSEAKMNTPGTPSGNWQWRCSAEMLTRPILARLGRMTETYGRSRS